MRHFSEADHGRMDRFWALVNRVDCACWDWLGTRIYDGYGIYRLRGLGPEKEISFLAHRIAYEATYGDIPDQHEIDHLCLNRGCVRPDHLRAVPPGFNGAQGGARRGEMQLAKTHCPSGHPLSGENLYQNPNNRKRACRTCRRSALARSKARKRGSSSNGQR